MTGATTPHGLMPPCTIRTFLIHYNPIYAHNTDTLTLYFPLQQLIMYHKTSKERLEGGFMGKKELEIRPLATQTIDEPCKSGFAHKKRDLNRKTPPKNALF